ncbi:MAG: hypothetical protein KZQ60_07840, partial [Candidatus Thiodiazotropha sp. (ex Lucinoma aequizonata)]|nr:hypothetical protein [Candidatus Thiodiazotropha sp. (ex Lucinoma aequizonata)]MCU7887864.1 hypothetical protein [Candidatus Thiodiazotropha sp. (ex Lucinoma aequizonata)]MCU7900408.1 hypothetical protein [Candidatus Thiodiazotropha sp. (ex Lucinoma aequizonata)]
IIIIFDTAAGKNSACIDNEARYNQARQYGFSEKMSFLPGTNYGSNNNVFSDGKPRGGSADNCVTITSKSFDFTN